MEEIKPELIDELLKGYQKPEVDYHRYRDALSVPAEVSYLFTLLNFLN